jgi:hypothetical protein
MTVLLTIPNIGTDADNFELYSDKDNFSDPFETGISRADLLIGYTSSVVPDYSSVVRVTSKYKCINSLDITLQ